MARITVGGTNDDLIYDSNSGRILTIPATIRWYSAKTGGTQHTDLLLNGQAVTEIPVAAKSVFPEHQWPDGVTVAWAAASTTGDFSSATRVKYDRTPASAGTVGGLVAGQNLADLPSPATARANLGIVPDSVVFSSASPATGASGSDRASQTRTLTQARMRVATAPVGSALTVRVQHSTNSGTSWTDAATLTIAAGSTTEAVSSTLSVAQAVGDLARIFVDSVGSTTPATGVVVDLVMA